MLQHIWVNPETLDIVGTGVTGTYVVWCFSSRFAQCFVKFNEIENNEPDFGNAILSVRQHRFLHSNYSYSNNYDKVTRFSKSYRSK